jgi:hypothetical protein
MHASSSNSCLLLLQVVDHAAHVARHPLLHRLQAQAKP